ncbi:MAG: protein kinase, partial [Streptosporangiales bacterium]
MGRVYLGFSPAGRAVALKVLHAERARDPAFRARFWREVAAVRRVSGAYTAPVLDAGTEEGRHWLATVFVAGPSLLELVRTEGPLPLPAAWRLAGGLVEALTAVHACGLVHRDLKPANVLLAMDGPRVIDFGLSRVVGNQAPSLSGLVSGTPGFMSPEQAKGEPVGPASDVFSLGSLLAFASTGSGPFGMGSSVTIMDRIVHGRPDLADVPESLRPLAEACLARDQASRPGLAELMAAIAPHGPGAAAGPPASFWPDPVARAIQSHQASLGAGTVAGGPDPVPGDDPGLAAGCLDHVPEDVIVGRVIPGRVVGGLVVPVSGAVSREALGMVAGDREALGMVAEGLGAARRGRKRVLDRRQAMSLIACAAVAAVGTLVAVNRATTPPPPPASQARPGAPRAAHAQGGQGAPSPSGQPAVAPTAQPTAQDKAQPTVPQASVGGTASAPPAVPPGLLRRAAHAQGNPTPPGLAK